MNKKLHKMTRFSGRRNQSLHLLCLLSTIPRSTPLTQIHPSCLSTECFSFKILFRIYLLLRKNSMLFQLFQLWHCLLILVKPFWTLLCSRISLFAETLAIALFVVSDFCTKGTSFCLRSFAHWVQSQQEPSALSIHDLGREIIAQFFHLYRNIFPFNENAIITQSGMHVLPYKPCSYFFPGQSHSNQNWLHAAPLVIVSFKCKML